MQTNHACVFKDGVLYASEMGLKIEIEEDSYTVTWEEDGETTTLNSLLEVKNKITRRRDDINEGEILKSSWQGVNFKTRKDDETLEPGCFNWLRKWQNAPTNIVREIYDLYCQTLNTKTFQLIRSDIPPTDTVCRLCKDGNESVMHVLNRCKALLKKPYTRRHDQVLKCFFFEILKMYGFLQECPPWYTMKDVEPYYDNDQYTVWWDIPEFAGANSEVNERDVFRPDGKIKLKNQKKIFVVEATVSWLDNRDVRYSEKVLKYEDVRRNIGRAEEGYEIDQITIVIDSLGGYSKSLQENISKVVSESKVVDRIITKMQKAVLCESSRISRCFKLGTQ